MRVGRDFRAGRQPSIVADCHKCHKHKRSRVTVSVIEQAKIQAQVLVPLVKALQAELGEEKANRIIRSALSDLYRRFGEEFWRNKNEPDLGKSVASAFK